MYYMVQVKSNSIIKEGKKAFLLPFEFDKKEVKKNSKKVIHDKLIADSMLRIPQYTKLEDNPLFTIMEVTKREMDKYIRTGIFIQKSIIKKGV